MEFIPKLILFETNIKKKEFCFFPLLKRQDGKENIDESMLDIVHLMGL